MAVLGVMVGLAGGSGAVGFRYLINFFQTLAYGSSNELLDVLNAIPWTIKVWIPAAGGLVVGPLIYFFAREAKGHGVPEVMEAVALRSGVIRKRVVLVKSLASAISISTGGPHCSNWISHRIHPGANAQGLPGTHADAGGVWRRGRNCRHLQRADCGLDVCPGGHTR